MIEPAMATQKDLEFKAMKNGVTLSESAKGRGKARTFYFKPDMAERIEAFSQKYKLSMSMLIRLALDEYMSKREGLDADKIDFFKDF